MEKITLTRKELYDLVWATPLTVISRKYQISDVGLRKVCVRMEIPLPKKGYWQRIRIGQQIRPKALSASFEGVETVTFSLRGKQDENYVSAQAQQITLQKEIESGSDTSIKVPDRLTNPDPLIVASKKGLEFRAKEYGLDNGLVHSARGDLDISVSPKNIGRALRFMDTFIKLIKGRGHRILFKDERTYVVAYDTEIKVVFRERLKMERVESKYSWDRTRFHPTGLLCLKIEFFHQPKEWIDGKVLIEDRLSKVLAKIEVRCKELRAEELLREKEREEKREKIRIQEALIRRKEKEMMDFKALLLKANRWRQVKLLRNYLDEVESKALENETNSDGLKNWLIWARNKADWYDPNIESTDELLQDFDQNSLALKSGASRT